MVQRSGEEVAFLLPAVAFYGTIYLGNRKMRTTTLLAFL